MAYGWAVVYYNYMCNDQWLGVMPRTLTKQPNRTADWRLIYVNTRQVDTNPQKNALANISIYNLSSLLIWIFFFFTELSSFLTSFTNVHLIHFTGVIIHDLFTNVNYRFITILVIFKILTQFRKTICDMISFYNLFYVVLLAFWSLSVFSKKPERTTFIFTVVDFSNS